MLAALAVPRHLPGAHDTHDEAAIAVVPPAEYEPGSQASDALSCVPPGNVVGNVTAGQKKPAGQGSATEKVGQ